MDRSIWIDLCKWDRNWICGDAKVRETKIYRNIFILSIIVIIVFKMKQKLFIDIWNGWQKKLVWITFTKDCGEEKGVYQGPRGMVEFH